ncbi:MAG: hypothetical protein U0263_27150 [Polyangiaceae bacterium]
MTRAHWLSLVSFTGLSLHASLANAACNGSGAAWSCAAGSSGDEVQAALDAASDGAVLEFQAGNYAFGKRIDFANERGVTLACVTPNACVVDVTSTEAVFYMDALSGENQKLYRISGFRFRNAPGGSTAIWIYGQGTLRNLRIDHNSFESFGADSIAILLGANGPYSTVHGVLDHNSVTGKDNFMFVKVLGPGSPETWPASPKGKIDAVYVEDNVVSFDNVQNLGLGCMDIWDSASIVWRHNKTQNCLVTSHGVVHGGGSVSFELYENELVRTAGSGLAEDGYRLFHHQGSGELIAFDNVFTAVAPLNSDAMGMTHYRSAPPAVAGYDASLGRCDGTNPIDGNRAPANEYFGYPCFRQPGRDGAAALSPMYVWNNRWSSTQAKIDLTIEDPWNAQSPSVLDHMVEDRDYYDAVSANAQSSPSNPFDGTKGMGFGTLANRPKTCTTNPDEPGGGVGYFATDDGPQGKLYRCSATNTWTLHYEPFQYPHPLVGGAGSGSGGTGGGSGGSGGGSSGAGGSSTNGGSAGSTAGTGGAKSSANGDDGGCGCETPRSGADSLYPFGLAALAAGLRHRRRVRRLRAGAATR